MGKGLRRWGWCVLANLVCGTAGAYGITPAADSLPGSMLGGRHSAASISEQFMAVPYRAGTLRGSVSEPEQLIANFQAVDCFTFLDYVEALRRATSLADFPRSLIEVRYRNHRVSFVQRRHFFSEWAMGPSPVAQDVTRQVSPRAVRVTKWLNRGPHGAMLIQGIAAVPHVVSYIPSAAVSTATLSHLQPGDYIGIYTDKPGLDVTHVGIYLETAAGPVLRNASSRRSVMQVVDSPLLAYLKDKPGIVVFRSTYHD